jgi:hypothetical protein
MPDSSKTNVPVPNENLARALPLHESIATRACELWYGYGRPPGRDMEIWLEAERQLLGTDARVVDQGFGSVPAPLLRQATAMVTSEPPITTNEA